MLVSLALLALTASTAVLGDGVKYAGVNIAGFDFGCDTSGNCDLSSVSPPITGIAGGGGDGAAQMQHFTQDDKFNIFRLPVGWQYLVDTPGGPLNTQRAGVYDQLVQSCLKVNAVCIIDIHNYARYNGKIIGQGGPSNEDFANLWELLAQKYGKNDGIAFGLVNEPHEVDMDAWAQTCQAAVTAIRNAGAKTQMILLPGNQYTAAGAFSQSGPALAGVKNPDGTTDGLIFDMHNYFDSDNSGTNPACATNKIDNGFGPAAQWLKSVNRQALITELGGGGTDPGCLTDVCQALDFLNQNSDVFLGWVAWAAGAFEPTYRLRLLTNGRDGGGDVPLVTQCFAGKFKGGSGATVSSDGSSNSSTSTSSSDSASSSSSSISKPVSFIAQKSANTKCKRSSKKRKERKERRRLAAQQAALAARKAEGKGDVVGLVAKPVPV